MSTPTPPLVVDFEIGGVALRMASREIASFAPPVCLTPAEWEVCQLALDGHGNRAIARARGVSARTIANQLQAIYGKLRVHGRGELRRALTVQQSDD